MIIGSRLNGKVDSTTMFVMSRKYFITKKITGPCIKIITEGMQSWDKNITNFSL